MEKRPRLRFLAGREDAGSTPDPAAPKILDNETKKILRSLMIYKFYIKCKNCNYTSQEFKNGVAFLFGNIGEIISILQTKDKKKVNQLKKKDKIHSFYSKGFSLYQCEKCYSIENKYHLLLTDNLGEIIFKSESFCQKCKITRQSLNINEKGNRYCCPNCLRLSLYILRIENDKFLY